MSLKPYPEYKDSGVNWLGQLPDDWEVRPSKSVFGLRNSPEVEGDIHLTPSQSLGVLPQSEYMRLTGNKVVLALAGTKMKHVEVEDFVIHLRSFQGGIEWSGYRGRVSPAYTVLMPKPGVFPAFFKYCLKSRGYIKTIASLTDQLRDGQSMRYYDFGKTPLPLPPLRDQRAIVEYLDQETAEIDAFIADQEELIVLLNERRAAMIEDKLYCIPSSRTTVGNDIDFVRFGSTFLESDLRAGSAGVDELLSVSIHHGVIPWAEMHDKEPRAASLGRYKLVRIGDIVLNRMRAFQGGLGVAMQDGVVSPDYMVLRVRNNVDSGYLGHLMKSNRFVAEMSSRLRGIGSSEQGAVRTPRINPRDLAVIWVPLPTLDNQRTIVESIDQEIVELEATIADARQSIALSKERRAALISAAVTGKIDVRDAVETQQHMVEGETVGVA